MVKFTNSNNVHEYNRYLAPGNSQTKNEKAAAMANVQRQLHTYGYEPKNMGNSNILMEVALKDEEDQLKKEAERTHVSPRFLPALHKFNDWNNNNSLTLEAPTPLSPSPSRLSKNESLRIVYSPPVHTGAPRPGRKLLTAVRTPAAASGGSYIHRKKRTIKKVRRNRRRYSRRN